MSSQGLKRIVNKEENFMNRDHCIGFGIGLLSGAAIGGIIALLYAPRSGKETRKLIGDKANEVVESVKEKSTGVVQALKN
jgi:gas vesicle protein